METFPRISTGARLPAGWVSVRRELAETTVDENHLPRDKLYQPRFLAILPEPNISSQSWRTTSTQRSKTFRSSKAIFRGRPFECTCSTPLLCRTYSGIFTAAVFRRSGGGSTSSWPMGPSRFMPGGTARTGYLFPCRRSMGAGERGYFRHAHGGRDAARSSHLLGPALPPEHRAEEVPQGWPECRPLRHREGPSCSAGCVVTLEGAPANAAKIPNICSHFGVGCIHLEGFMEREGWSVMDPRT